MTEKKGRKSLTLFYIVCERIKDVYGPKRV